MGFGLIFDSSEKLDYSSDDENVDSDDVCSSTTPSDHSKYTFLTAKERSEVYGPRESSARPSGSSPCKA